MFEMDLNYEIKGDFFMVRLEAALIITGANFSPMLVEARTGIAFSEKNEVGDIGTRGLHKNKPIPYGSATLTPPIECLTHNYSGFDWIVDKLESIVQVSRDNGADDIYLDLAVYHDAQCNLAFEPVSLEKIAKANVPFWISCYEDYESED